MVQFARQRLGRRQQLTVRTAPALRGHRVIVAHPDGRRIVHDFPDYSARYVGTIAIQTALLRDGWRPVRPARRQPGAVTRCGQRPAARAWAAAAG